MTPADVAVGKIIAAVNPSGLHFAFLDPFNLEGLSFDIISKLSKLETEEGRHAYSCQRAGPSAQP